MKFTTLLFALLITSSLYGQYSIDESLVDRAILIEIPGAGTGSGFLYQDSTHVYLITARHVLLDFVFDNKGVVVDRKLKGEVGVVSFYARNSDRSSANVMECNFVQLYKMNKLKFGENNDILVIELGEISEEEGYLHIVYNEGVRRYGEISRINPFFKDNFGFFEETNLGDDIFIFGYPTSLGLQKNDQYDFKRPLLRKGTLAGRDVTRKNIIIDCPAFGGNSGGPVVEVTKDREVKVIGIVVSFIPYAEVWENSRYGLKNVEIINSGYSVVESIDKIMELIDRF